MIAQGRPTALPAFSRGGEGMSPPAGLFGRGRTAWALAACAALLAGFGEKAWLAPAQSAPTSWVTSSEVTNSLPALHGAPMMARFERMSQRNGSEILRGETRLQFTGAARSLTVREEALVDRDGRLVRAEIGVSSLSGDETWARVVSFDALTGVIVTTRGGRAEARRAPTDQPWAYVPVAAPDGTWVATPVAATVAERAAHAGSAIRLIDPSGADAAVMSDQIAGASGAEGWVVLGDDLAVFSERAAGAGELVRMHVASLGVMVSAEGASLTPR